MSTLTCFNGTNLKQRFKEMVDKGNLSEKEAASQVISEEHKRLYDLLKQYADQDAGAYISPVNYEAINDQKIKNEKEISALQKSIDETANQQRSEENKRSEQSTVEKKPDEKTVDTAGEPAEGDGKGPPGKPPVDNKGADGDFFDGKSISLTGERAQYLSKPTIEVSGKEITQPFEYEKVELDALVEDGKRWIAEAKEIYNGSPVEYAVKMYSAIKNLKNMPVKAVSMVSLLNAIDLDLKYRELSFGQRDQLKSVRRGLELEIAKNARDGSLVLNTQRLIHKLYKGEYKFTEATASIVTDPVQKQADTVIEKVREETTEVSEVVREAKRKEADKEDVAEEEAPKPKPKKEKKTTFFEKRLGNVSQAQIDKLKKDISDIANAINCGKKK